MCVSKINDNGFVQLQIKAQHLLCAHMDHLHHLFHSPVIIILFSTSNLIIFFILLLNKEQYQWQVAVISDALYSFLNHTRLCFSKTRNRFSLKSKTLEISPQLYLPFWFICIRLYILSTLYMLRSSTCICRFLSAFIFHIFLTFSTSFPTAVPFTPFLHS